MSIILAHIWRNIKDKKLISALIILSLVITGALLFVALSIAGVMDAVADSDFQSVNTIFMLIFIVTSFMSVFVVYSSFKYIMALRVKTMGTLRSIGADKKSCRRLLLLESLVYGFIGAVLAVIAGIVLLLILSGSMSGGKAELVISAPNILITILFCLLLSPICAYIPVKSSDKYSVKEIILQTHKVKEKNRLPVLVVGLALLAVGIALVQIDALKYEEAAIYGALLCSLAGFVLSVGPLVYYLNLGLSKIFPDSLTFKMMKENRTSNNIAVLLAIAVAVVFMINSSNAILVEATDKSFELYNYDIQISTKTNDALYDEAAVTAAVGIAGSAVGIYYKTEAETDKIPLMNLYGMTAEKMNIYFSLTIQEEVLEIEDGEILLSRDYMARQNLAVGDKLTIKGTNFTIVGVINEMFNSGNVGIISENSFKDLYGIENYTMIVCITASGEEETARDELRANGFPSAATLADMLARVKSINADLFTIVDYIILLSTTAGVFGVLNNILIALVSRKKERALLRSVGMSKRRSAGSIVTEAIVMGFTGGIFGLLGGILLTAVIPAVFLVFEFPVMPVPLSAPALLLCVFGSAAICLVASLFSLIGDSKLDITKTLREEIL